MRPETSRTKSSFLLIRSLPPRVNTHQTLGLTLYIFTCLSRCGISFEGWGTTCLCIFHRSKSSRDVFLGAQKVNWGIARANRLASSSPGRDCGLHLAGLRLPWAGSPRGLSFPAQSLPPGGFPMHAWFPFLLLSFQLTQTFICKIFIVSTFEYLQMFQFT